MPPPTADPVRPKLNSEYLKRSQLLYQKIELNPEARSFWWLLKLISPSTTPSRLSDVPLIFSCVVSPWLLPKRTELAEQGITELQAAAVPLGGTS